MHPISPTMFLQLTEQASGVGCWCLDSETHELFWSEQTCRIHGMDPSTYTPTLDAAIEFYHPDDREMVRLHVERALEHGTTYAFECRLIRADGAERIVKAGGQCVTNPRSGQTTLVFGTFQDITEHRHTEETLRGNERKWRSIMDTVLDCIIMIDTRGIIKSVNPACHRLLGYSEEELLGKNINMLMNREHATHHDQYLANYLRTGEARIIGIGREVEAKCKDGTLLPVDLSISEFEIDGERNFVGVLHDVSERKQNEQEMNRLIERLTESNEELEHYAYVCSHDLQEPLRMIRGFSQKLKQTLLAKNQMDEMMEHYLHYITTNAERAQELVRDVLAYARLEKEDMPAEPVNLAEIMRMVKESLAGLVEHSHADIRVENLPILQGSRTQFYQLMLNLVSNGLKFQPAGQAAIIRVWGSIENERHVVCVEDNGIGIRPEHRNKVFRIFKRLHHRSEYPGNGIGLALCKKIMERHGGTVRFTSEEGKGTAFYLSFPIHSQENRNDHAQRQAS